MSLTPRDEKENQINEEAKIPLRVRNEGVGTWMERGDIGWGNNGKKKKTGQILRS